MGSHSAPPTPLGASEAEPARLGLNHEILACGVAPRLVVEPGTATTIATGGMIPRGADAVVMVEATEIASGEGALAIDLDRGAAPGQFVGYAGSDMARGETVLRKGTVVTAREIGMLAACGLDAVEMVRRPRVAVLSTGDELSPPGQTLPAAGIYDSNGAIVSASVTENGGEPVPFGIVADDEAALESAIRAALSECDVVVLSGGTSKGAGDVSHRILSRLGEPGILVHGVALKPGKPLCLAKAQGKAIVVLPGFPTSAIFTFHEFVVPLIRSLAGLPPREEESVEAVLPRRIPSELGRMEFVMASLAHGRDAPVAVPLSKGSGSVTAFSQADGFFAIPAARAGLEAGEPVRLSRIGAGTRAPDLTIVGSHCVGLDAVVGRLAERGIRARTIWVGSSGGLAALKRGECEIASMHLFDPTTGRYNAPFLTPALRLAEGWTRMQGLVFHPGDSRFAERDAAGVVAALLLDPDAIMVGRNTGSGTRLLIDGLSERGPPSRLLEPATFAQRRCRRGRPRPSRLGCRHRGRRECLWPRLPAAGERALRFRLCRRSGAGAGSRHLPRAARRAGNGGASRRTRIFLAGGPAMTDRTMRVIGLAGWSGAGKTTLLAKLIPELIAPRLHGLDDQARAPRLRRGPAGQGFPPAPAGRRIRSADLVGGPVGADARSARRRRGGLGRPAAPPQPLRPRAGGRIQARGASQDRDSSERQRPVRRFTRKTRTSSPLRRMRNSPTLGFR